MSELRHETSLGSVLPRRTVLSTPELFEAILLSLPLRDLLVNAPRVNRFWNQTISRSPKLQQALFFKAEDAATVQVEPYFNPLLVSSFPAFLPDLKTTSDFWGHYHEVFTSLDWNRSEKKRIAYSRKEASWRRMLIVQPRVQTLEVVKKKHYQRRSTKAQGKVRLEEGARMGTLYDLVQKEMCARITRFKVLWSSKGITAPDQPRAGEGSNADDEEWPRIVVVIDWTRQCTVGKPSPIGPEFESQGYEEVDFRMAEV